MFWKSSPAPDHAGAFGSLISTSTWAHTHIFEKPVFQINDLTAWEDAERLMQFPRGKAVFPEI